MTKCRLCQLEKPLIKKAHIVPDWMYEDLYTNQHKLYRFSPADYIEGNRRVDMPSTGEYEANLLCARCDGDILGSYEDYAKKALQRYGLPRDKMPDVLPYRRPDGVECTLLTNIDYAKFKLFLLSILWRASISRRNWCREVNLGSHEATIREMLWNRDPGTVDQYPVMVLSYDSDPSLKGGAVAEPAHHEDEQGTRYSFLIARALYIYHISADDIPSFVFDFAIKPDNEMTLLHTPQGTAFGLLLKYCGVTT